MQPSQPGRAGAAGASGRDVRPPAAAYCANGRRTLADNDRAQWPTHSCLQMSPPGDQSRGGVEDTRGRGFANSGPRGTSLRRCDWVQGVPMRHPWASTSCCFKHGAIFFQRRDCGSLICDRDGQSRSLFTSVNYQPRLGSDTGPVSGCRSTSLPGPARATARPRPTSLRIAAPQKSTGLVPSALLWETVVATLRRGLTARRGGSPASPPAAVPCWQARRPRSLPRSPPPPRPLLRRVIPPASYL